MTKKGVSGLMAAVLLIVSAVVISTIVINLIDGGYTDDSKYKVHSCYDNISVEYCNNISMKFYDEYEYLISSSFRCYEHIRTHKLTQRYYFTDDEKEYCDSFYVRENEGLE